MTRLLLILLISAFAHAASDPNEPSPPFPWKHWLEPVSWVDKVRLVPAINDPNMVLRVTYSKPVDRLDLADFCRYAQSYRPVVVIKPVEPNEPAEPNLAEVLEGVTDPNLAAAIREMMTR